MNNTKICHLYNNNSNNSTFFIFIQYDDTEKTFYNLKCDINIYNVQ